MSSSSSNEARYRYTAVWRKHPQYLPVWKNQFKCNLPGYLSEASAGCPWYGASVDDLVDVFLAELKPQRSPYEWDRDKESHAHYAREVFKTDIPKGIKQGFVELVPAGLKPPEFCRKGFASDPMQRTKLIALVTWDRRKETLSSFLLEKIQLRVVIQWDEKHEDGTTMHRMWVFAFHNILHRIQFMARCDRLLQWMRIRLQYRRKRRVHALDPCLIKDMIEIIDSFV
jgi:hypothetical protein